MRTRAGYDLMYVNVHCPAGTACRYVFVKQEQLQVRSISSQNQANVNVLSIVIKTVRPYLQTITLPSLSICLVVVRCYGHNVHHFYDTL